MLTDIAMLNRLPGMTYTPSEIKRYCSEHEWITLKDAEKELRVSHTTLRKMIRDKEIQYRHMPGDTRRKFLLLKDFERLKEPVITSPSKPKKK